MIKPASDEIYRGAWEREIDIGVSKGKLTQSAGKADLRIAGLPPEENAAFNKQYGKE